MIEPKELTESIDIILSQLPQQEISDEQIREQAIKYDNGAFSETPIVHFMEGCKWYREQLKQRQ
jgi:hypothetical protein